MLLYLQVMFYTSVAYIGVVAVRITFDVDNDVEEASENGVWKVTCVCASLMHAS